MAGTEPASHRIPCARPALLSSLGIFALALTVRLLHVWQIHGAPFFVVKMGDARAYDAWARQIAAGQWLGDQVFYQAPLYPYFLAVVYALLGDGPLVLRCVQIVIGALSCVLLALATASFFSRSAGVVAGLMLSLYPPAIFFDALVQKSVLDLFLSCLLLCLAGGLLVAPRRPVWVGTGAVLGLLILVRENALVFVVAIGIWLVVAFRPSGRRRVAFAGYFLLGLILVLLPVALRNQWVGGEFHLTTAQFGTAFYIGNNENADGQHAPLVPFRGDPRFERQDATELAERASGRKLTPGEVSRYWARQAFEYIRSRPVDWGLLELRKFVLFWNAIELIDMEDQYTHADWSLPLRVTGVFFHFGVLAPLAMLGAWVTWRRRSHHWLIFLMLGLYTASVLVFFIFARYRLPAVAYLVPLAAAGLVGLREFFGSARRGVVGGALAATAAAAVFCNWPIGWIDSRTSVDGMRAATQFNLGAEIEESDPESAILHYRRAIELKADFPRAHLKLGIAHQHQGRIGEAVGHYHRALEIRPDFAAAHFNLATALASRDDVDGAMHHYVQYLRIVPEDSEAHNNLGNLLQSRGRLDEAVRHYREALRLDPGHARTHFNLAVAMGRLGRRAEAVAHLEEALRIEPDLEEARRILESLGGRQPPAPVPE